MKTVRIIAFILCSLLCLSLECDDISDPTEKDSDKWRVDIEDHVYIYPPRYSEGVSRTPYFKWHSSKSSARNAYQFSIRTGLGNIELVNFRTTTLDTFIQCPDTLDAETDYIWDVIAYDPSNRTDGRIGSFWDFKTGTGFNNPPLTPFDPDPEDEFAGTYLYATLNWDCYDPDGDDLTYDVWFQPSLSDSVLIGDDITAKTIDPGDLERGMIYFWKVIASDPSGDSAAGPWWEFETIPEPNKPPVEPWGEYPPDDETGVPLNVSLSWDCTDPEDGPLTYSVTMGHAGGTLTQIGSGLSDKFLEVNSLDPSIEYEWFVSATDDHSQTTSGQMWSFTTGDGSQTDVFAELTLRRNILFDGSTISRIDLISARFDSVYAPEGPIHPLQPAAVAYGTFALTWSEGSKMYSYSDYMAGYFLTPGQTNTFTVAEGGNVPALVTDPIALPVCAPYITSPAAWSSVSLDGFDLEWHTSCSGMIDITILDHNNDSTGVYIRTEDDGFYRFEASDLSTIDPSAYNLKIVLIVEDRRTITSVGYDPRSWMWARTLAPRFVNIQ